jgi:hypothetical protein
MNDFVKKTIRSNYKTIIFILLPWIVKISPIPIILAAIGAFTGALFSSQKGMEAMGSALLGGIISGIIGFGLLSAFFIFILYKENNTLLKILLSVLLFLYFLIVFHGSSF